MLGMPREEENDNPSNEFYVTRYARRINKPKKLVVNCGGIQKEGEDLNLGLGVATKNKVIIE